MYPANIGVVGHGSKVRESMAWQWGEGGANYGVLAKTILGEMSYWNDIPPKIGKDELESLGACHEGW